VKPPEPAAAGKPPYAERDDIIARHCSCHFVWSDQDGKIVRRERLWRDPKCKLHGSNASPSPF
jgi:hypothetical protein